MKNLTAFITVCLMLFFSHKSQTFAQTTPSAGFPKIGYTNVDVILGRLPEGKIVQSQLETTKTQLTKAIDETIKEFQAKAEAYQKNGKQMTEVIRADKERELENLQTRIQEMQNNAQQSLQNKQQQLVDPLLVKINTAIQQVGKENSYGYIFNMDAGPGTMPFILFTSSEDNNLTNLVLRKLGVDPDKAESSAANAAPPSKPAAAKK
jgi:outer membrane protein